MKLKTNLSLEIDQFQDDKGARSFCNDFIHSSMPKFIFGTNEYAASIANHIDVDGFINEFTTSKEFMGKPIVQLNALPKESIVVSVVVLARPQSVLKKLNEYNIRCIDYFRFRKYSGLHLLEVSHQSHNDFNNDFNSNRLNYDKIYSLLEDSESRQVMTKIINFRLSDDLKYMNGFIDVLDRQYFEDFLKLKPMGEVFVDVGCFDGFTSLQFIEHCPNYDAIYVFEPEAENMIKVKERLSKFPRIVYNEFGLSNQAQTLRFKSQGSSSVISTDGDTEIKVKRLDDVIQEPFTFIKMDIEGGEPFAIEGAKQSILKYHPRLAISVYHRFNDLWCIPQQILSIREDYRIYLRHYTEGVIETVMFFMPK